VSGMDIEQAREFVGTNHRGVLTTRKKDGAPQTSPVVAALDGAGRIVISSRETAYKVKNLRRDPRATYTALNDGFFGAWAQVDGTAEIISLPAAMDHLVDYYRAISGEHDDWDDYRAAMERERRVVIAITPETAGPNVSG
jgi:PPOX class probable F420-dependent enzyme